MSPANLAFERTRQKRRAAQLNVKRRGYMLGASSRNRTGPPQAAIGANRYTVETENKSERTEVLSYGKFKVGDCVKLMMGHPTKFARLFDLRPGEHCAVQN